MKEIDLGTFMNMNKLLNELTNCGAKNPCIAGGFLRDNLLEKAVNDVDVFYEGGLSVEQIMHISESFGLGDVDGTDTTSYENGTKTVVTFTSKLSYFGGIPVQLINVDSVKDTFDKFPCFLSKVIYTPFGLTMTKPFYYDVLDNFITFTKKCPSAYKEKLKEKYEGWFVQTV